MEKDSYNTKSSFHLHPVLAIVDIDIPESEKGLRPLGNLLVSIPHCASLGIQPSDPPLSLVDPSRHVTIALLLSLFKF